MICMCHMEGDLHMLFYRDLPEGEVLAEPRATIIILPLHWQITSIAGMAYFLRPEIYPVDL